MDGRGAQVAQLVEHATENRSVGGSIPPLGTLLDPCGVLVQLASDDPDDWTGRRCFVPDPFQFSVGLSGPLLSRPVGGFRIGEQTCNHLFERSTRAAESLALPKGKSAPRSIG
jgi:hypothetical protein